MVNESFSELWLMHIQKIGSSDSGLVSAQWFVSFDQRVVLKGGLKLVQSSNLEDMSLEENVKVWHALCLWERLHHSVMPLTNLKKCSPYSMIFHKRKNGYGVVFWLFSRLAFFFCLFLLPMDSCLHLKLERTEEGITKKQLSPHHNTSF